VRNKRTENTCEAYETEMKGKSQGKSDNRKEGVKSEKRITLCNIAYNIYKRHNNIIEHQRTSEGSILK
jgi:hypothetical protein